MSLGERIKERRQACGMSQEKVAELMGVSRQAVTKWESGQSAPSTENLFKLAGIFGTKVDVLLPSQAQDRDTQAEQSYRLYKTEEERKRAETRARRKKGVLTAPAAAAGYCAVWLVTNLICGWEEGTSVMGRFHPDAYRSCLMGWLVRRGLFWGSLALSAVPALFGKYRFSLTTLGGFAAGVLLGEVFGKNPDPAAAFYGTGAYGWLIWGLVFLLSAALGVVLEGLRETEPLTATSKKLWIWCAAAVLGAAAIVLLVRAGFPQAYGS